MLNDEVRVGLIGYGIAGQRFHGPLIEATDGLRVSAVTTANPARAAEAVRAHPDVTILSSVDELWQFADELDVIVVGSPNLHHAEHAIGALKAGLAVVVDKPISGSSEEAERIIDAASTLGGFLTVFQNRRWDSDFLTVRDVVSSERLGTVRRFESRFERWQPTVAGGWRESAGVGEGGGVLFDLGAHVIDQALVLFGPVTSVYAEQFRGRAGSEVDDDTFVALRHNSGVVSHLWTSKLAADHGPRFRVLGARGAFVKQGMDTQEDQAAAGMTPAVSGWGLEPETTWGELTDGNDAVTVPSRLGAYQDFYIALRDALRTGGKPPVDPRDSLYVLRLIEAAGTSARERRTVAVDATGRVEVETR